MFDTTQFGYSDISALTATPGVVVRTNADANKLPAADNYQGVSAAQVGPIVTAAVNPAVTAAVAALPAGTDHFPGPDATLTRAQVQAILAAQTQVSVTVNDGDVVNGRTLHRTGPVVVAISEVSYTIPLGVSTLVPTSIKTLLQNSLLLA